MERRKEQSLSRLVVCSVMIGMMLVTGTDACPERCLCYRTTVRCMFLQLKNIPVVPPETTTLDLRFNKIQLIPSGAFIGLKNLNTLLLNNNNIKEIQNDAFHGLSELKYLYLYKNKIRTIASQAFHELGKLEQLYIHFNKIEHLDEETFSKLPVLERLFLHNNVLKRLPSGLFRGLKSLRRLRLDSNALICDCQLMWLSEMLKKNIDFTEAAATCEYPLPVKGKSLMSISKEEFRCKKPELTAKPQDVQVNFGSTVYFRCRATGDPIPEIIWMHNNEEVSLAGEDERARKRYSQLEDGTLMIEDTQGGDEGVYECVAKNAAGETKANAVELSHTGARARPSIRKKPRDVTVTEGEVAALDCLATGTPRPAVTWTRNDLPLPPDPRLSVDPITARLVIARVRYDDRGEYRCSAANAVATVTAVGSINVQVPPTFSQRPEGQSVMQGQAVFFSCLAAGHPSPVISWFKGDERLVDSAHFTINPSATTLQIAQVHPADVGAYRCRAENPAGTAETTADLEVTARSRPRLLQGPADVQVAAGAFVVEFSCRVHAVPPARVTWVKNSSPVVEDAKFTVELDGRLIIRDVRPSDAGTYECVARNAAGTMRAFASLTVTSRRLANALDDATVYSEEALTATVADARRQVETAINRTLRQFFSSRAPRTAHDLLSLARYPNAATLRISRAAEIFERTLEAIYQQELVGITYNISLEGRPYEDVLTQNQVSLVADLSGCTSHRRVVDCTNMCYHLKYRTYDGTCNSLRHPMRGASITPVSRLLPPVYENGLNTPVGWTREKLLNGFALPSARAVSLQLASSRRITADERYTYMLMQWGQFVDHDITLMPQAVAAAQFSDGRFCNETCHNQAPCFPIPVAPGDARIRRHRCIGMTRSSAVCGSGATSVLFGTVAHREQINEITAYLDASMVYGSTEEEVRNLRDYESGRGLMRAGLIMPSGKALLPPNRGEPVDCQIDPAKADVPCFQAGDFRANEQLGLTAMHTLWMREHNRIAGELVHLNPHWDADTLFHEARKIVGALVQHITYEHWLPKVLGPRGMAMLGAYAGYDPAVDATIVNSFATAAFRFGHTLINPVMHRLNATFQPIAAGNLPLHKAFFAPYRIIEEGGIDPIVRGFFATPSKKLAPGEVLNTELTEKLFTLANEVALDLAAVNVQRGRDHGLPSYNAFRRFCGLEGADTFDGLRAEISSDAVRRRLQQLYGHPDNIDLWIGAASEDLVEGARMGPTFMCIITAQFRRVRDGDRFWYTNPGVFSSAQLSELRQASLSRIICDNSDDIQRVQRDAFLLGPYPASLAECSADVIPRVDLKVWAHCCQDCSSSGDFRSITKHFRTKRSATFSHRWQMPPRRPPPPATPPPTQPPTPPPTRPVPPAVTREAGSSRGKGYSIEGEVTKMSHNVMDLVDVRIEGVEDVMAAMKKTVRKLMRKVRRLERGATGRRGHAAPPPPPLTCRDNKGLTRRADDTWKESDCKTCLCKKGSVECTVTECPPLICQWPVRSLPGQCCPVC